MSAHPSVRLRCINMQAEQPVAIAVEACATAAGEAEASGLPREYPRSALKS